MGEKNDWEHHLEPVKPRHPLETRNSLSSDGEVDIMRGVFQDERLPHTVYVDSIVHQTLDNFDAKGVDLMVREVPMQTTKANAPEADNESYGRHRTSPDVVMFDLDNMKVAAYDAKSVHKGLEGLEELREWGEDVRTINEQYGMEWAVTGHDIQTRHIQDDYRSPRRSPRGVYVSRDSYEDVMSSDELDHLFNGLYGSEADLEDAVFVSEVKDKWKL